jgi:hypothetical protein
MLASAYQDTVCPLLGASSYRTNIWASGGRCDAVFAPCLHLAGERHSANITHYYHRFERTKEFSDIRFWLHWDARAHIRVDGTHARGNSRVVIEVALKYDDRHGRDKRRWPSGIYRNSKRGEARSIIYYITVFRRQAVHSWQPQADIAPGLTDIPAQVTVFLIRTRSRTGRNKTSAQCGLPPYPRIWHIELSLKPDEIPRCIYKNSGYGADTALNVLG